jgi:hypothetical protein
VVKKYGLVILLYPIQSTYPIQVYNNSLRFTRMYFFDSIGYRDFPIYIYSSLYILFIHWTNGLSQNYFILPTILMCTTKHPGVIMCIVIMSNLTLQVSSVFDLIDWSQFHVDSKGWIRDSDCRCPLQAVFGREFYIGRSVRAIGVFNSGEIIVAADTIQPYSVVAKEFRNEMLRRMEAASSLRSEAKFPTS